MMYELLICGILVYISRYVFLYNHKIWRMCVLSGRIYFRCVLHCAVVRCHRVSVFENRVLWRIFGPKRDEVAGGWRKLHNEELHNLYSSPSIIFFIASGVGLSLLYCGHFWSIVPAQDDR
jgi:hypothetical protein